MHRDNRRMYMTHVCFYVCCSDCVGVCGNVSCVAAVVKDSETPLQLIFPVLPPTYYVFGDTSPLGVP